MSAITIADKVGIGVEQSSPYGPIVRQTFQGPIAAGENVLAVKIPTGCIPNAVALIVRKPSTGTCTVKVGNIKGFNGTEVFTAGTYEATGKTLSAAVDTVYAFPAQPSATGLVVAGNAEYVTFTPNNAIPDGTEFDIKLFASYTLRYPIEE